MIYPRHRPDGPGQVGRAAHRRPIIRPSTMPIT